MGCTNGKLLVYASDCALAGDRVESINAAIGKTAKILGLGVEVVTVHREYMPTYVYYADEGEEPVPIYCDKNEEINLQDICMTLRNMIFVLSFHPKYSALKQARKAIMQSS